MGWASRRNPLSALTVRQKWARRIARRIENEAQLEAALQRVPAMQREAIRAAIRPFLRFELSSPLAISQKERIAARRLLDTERQRA